MILTFLMGLILSKNGLTVLIKLEILNIDDFSQKNKKEKNTYYTTYCQQTWL